MAAAVPPAVETDRTSIREDEENEDPALVQKRETKMRRERRMTWVLFIVATVLVLTFVSLILYFGITNPGPASDSTGGENYFAEGICVYAV